MLLSLSTLHVSRLVTLRLIFFITISTAFPIGWRAWLILLLLGRLLQDECLEVQQLKVRRLDRFAVDSRNKLDRIVRFVPNHLLRELHVV